MSNHVVLVFGLFVSLAAFLGVVGVATGEAVVPRLAGVVVLVGLLAAVGLGFVLMVAATR